MMMYSAIRFYRDKTATAATEFALVAPMLTMLLVGVGDFGIYINARMKMDSVSRAVAQYLMLGGDPAYIQSDIIDNSDLELSNDEWNYEDVYECADGAQISEAEECSQGDYKRHFVQVSINKEYESILPMGDHLPASMNLSSFVKIQVPE